MSKGIIGLIIQIVLLGGINLIATLGNESAPKTSNSSSRKLPVTSKTPTSIPTTTNFEPIIIKGNGDKTSAPFTVTTAEWIIDWKYDAEKLEWAAFGLFIYPRGETNLFVEGLLSDEDEDEGSTYSYAGPGEYYVKVLTANLDSWEIIIRPPN